MVEDLAGLLRAWSQGYAPASDTPGMLEPRNAGRTPDADSTGATAPKKLNISGCDANNRTGAFPGTWLGMAVDSTKATVITSNANLINISGNTQG